MPEAQDIQNAILAGGQRISAIMLAGVPNEQAGFPFKGLKTAKSLYLYINALIRQYNIGDYISDAVTAIYDCVVQMAGQPLGGTIDPNYQPQNMQIVTNPNILGPTILGYGDFEASSTDPTDQGRTLYINAAWKGRIPVMSAGSPLLSLLENGVDFALLPTGGFILLPTSTTMPKIYSNQNILVTGFENQ